MVDDKKQKGGKNAELKTALVISEDIYVDYCAPDEKDYWKETNAKRKIRLHRIERRWAKEWRDYKYVTPKYTKKFPLKPPCNTPPLGDQQSAHPSSMVTIEDYREEKAKYLAKLSKVAKQVVMTFSEESAPTVAASTSTVEACATEPPPKKALMKKSGVKPKSSKALTKQQNPQPAPSVAAMSSSVAKYSLPL
ncbi:hypothetical protein ZWY2020_038069 [Hordeum vulgare]|nr:hypothetical protein ZWY2020_038069 [Hordeum vulgare]